MYMRWAAFCIRTSYAPGFDLFDEGNGIQIKELMSVTFQDLLVMNGLWLDTLVIQELGASPHEREEMVIIKTPHAMATGRLQNIIFLYRPHHFKILHKNLCDKGLIICFYKYLWMSCKNEQ